MLPRLAKMTSIMSFIRPAGLCEKCLPALDALPYILSITVTFNSVWQPCIMGPFKLPKCHVGRGHFCRMPKSFGDLALQYRKFLLSAPQKLAKISTCHGKFGRLLEPKFHLMCLTSHGVLNWFKWCSIMSCGLCIISNSLARVFQTCGNHWTCGLLYALTELQTLWNVEQPWWKLPDMWKLISTCGLCMPWRNHQTCAPYTLSTVLA